MRHYTPSIPAVECPPLVPDNTPVLVCPSCGDTMMHVRTIPKLGTRLEQFNFVCPSCEQVDYKGRPLAPRRGMRPPQYGDPLDFRNEGTMRIRVGCEISFELPQITPMIATLNVHFSRISQLEHPDYLTTNPSVPIEGYRDSFGNWCNRLVAPSGHFSLGTDVIIRDSGMPDPLDLNALQHQVENLPAETILFLLGSRYCETDRLSDEAWRLFGNTPLGWPRVQAICDFVHNHIVFGYEYSRPTRTAFEAYQEQRGVCRDYAHLPIAFCRCLNIPARYCTGYITDIGLPPPYAPMDFAAWIEVYLGDRWYAFDPRNNAPRIGRILIAHGRDAADVPLTHTFGTGLLSEFRVWADEVPAE